MICDTFQKPTTLRLVLKKDCNFVRDNLSASVGSSDEELYVYSIKTIVISLLKMLYQIQLTFRPKCVLCNEGLLK